VEHGKTRVACAHALEQRAGAIRRIVVDEQDVDVETQRTDRLHHARSIVPFVIRRDDHQRFEGAIRPEWLVNGERRQGYVSTMEIISA
jgi:hypothetical protein